MFRFVDKALLKMVGIVVAMAVIAAGCGGSGGGGDAGGGTLDDYDLSDAEIAVGSKDFTEQQILGQITVKALEAAGASVNDQVGLAGTNAAREALLNGEIDMYWEYTGTGWITHLGNTDPITDSKKQYEAVKKADLKENDIEWLEPAPFNNTYALAVREEAYEDLGVEKLSDMEKLIEERPEEATICVESEFNTRDDGLPGLEKTYGYEFKDSNKSLVDTGVVYTQTDKGKCNFGEVFTTDGRIEALGLKIIEDDKKFFPVYNPALNVRKDVLEENPDLKPLAADLAKALDTKTMQQLNASVDVDGESYDAAADKFLEDNGFIK